MITEKTVLITGAGASVPYDYPAGESLVKLICEGLGAYHGSLTNSTKRLIDLGFGAEIVLGFVDALRKSGRLSVDAFLEHRTEFIEIGKCAIAQQLIRQEYPEKLFSVDSSENWYQYLFNKMSTSFEDLSANELSIVTFNYDRSLEHYLHTAIMNAYGVDDAKAAEKLQP